MKIETDRYLITGTANDYTVQLKRITQDSPMLKDKSKVGGVSLSDKRYYPTLEKAYSGIANQLTLDSDTIKSLDDVKMLYRELIEEVKFLKV